MSSFSFTLTLRLKPSGVSRMTYKTEIEPVLTPLGFCLSVIVKGKPLNHEKTTSSVISVILFNLWSLISNSDF